MRFDSLLTTLIGYRPAQNGTRGAAYTG